MSGFRMPPGTGHHAIGPLFGPLIIQAALTTMTAFFSTFNYHIDGFLIFFYRLTGYALVDYLIGTFCLAFICVVVGEISVSLALKFNRRYFDEMNAEMLAKERLSLQAYQAGDMDGYKGLNKEATDVWGRRFFTMVGYSAGILWPIPFALGWMQSRFAAVEFDLAFPLSLVFGHSVGYIFTFIPIYILCRILFKYMRPHLPYFKGIQNILNEYDTKKPQ
jgi:hypothetical protein